MNKYVLSDILKPIDEFEYKHWGLFIVFSYNKNHKKHHKDAEYILFSFGKNVYKCWSKNYCEVGLERINNYIREINEYPETKTNR